jgi:ATP-dependent 26S proteasome regulatory subunit
MLVLQLVSILGLSHHDEKSPEAVHELNVELNNLKLSQDGDCGDEVNLYRIVEGTKWNVESVGSTVEKESSQNKSTCSLASVGGLQDVIEEICEIIQLALRSTPLVQGMYCNHLFYFCLPGIKGGYKLYG